MTSKMGKSTHTHYEAQVFTALVEEEFQESGETKSKSPLGIKFKENGGFLGCGPQTHS